MDSFKSNANLSQEITGPLLVDLIRDHLNSCSKCDQTQRPIGLGQKSRMCDDYWTMVQGWADREGAANNVVAHDEFGHDAPKKLDPNTPTMGDLRYT